KSARESYERMIRWVDQAEKRLSRSRPVSYSFSPRRVLRTPAELGAIANVIRGTVQGMIVRHRASPEILRFVNSRESRSWSQRGPATPDHIIRTKAMPLLVSAEAVRDTARLRKALEIELKKFQQNYQAYFV